MQSLMKIVCDAAQEQEPEFYKGASVFVYTLRKAFERRVSRPESVDLMLLKLHEEGLIRLRLHPTPHWLSASQRRELVNNGMGGYFESFQRVIVDR